MSGVQYVNFIRGKFPLHWGADFRAISFFYIDKDEQGSKRYKNCVHMTLEVIVVVTKITK